MTLRSKVSFLALTALGGIVAPVWAQFPGPAGGYPGAGHAAAPAIYQQPMGGSARTAASQMLVDAHGQPAVVPVQHLQGGMPAGGCYGDCSAGGYPGGGLHGGGAHAWGGGFDYNLDQSGPHYFDVDVQFVSLQRDEIFRGYQAFTHLNVANPGALTDVLLSSDDIEADYEPGFRVTGRIDICPLSVFEVSYMGIYDFASSATAVDPNPVSPTEGNLFSPFSDFGRNPAGGLGLDETDRAVLHRISYDSDLQTAELSYRRYWVGYSPRVSGTILAGFRYTRLSETFNFHSEALGTLDYNERTENDLAGFQTGGDAWITLRQGLRVGSEGKVGIYNNHVKLRNRILASDGSPDILEAFEEDQVAFIGEASVDVIADILPSWSLRAGYEILYLNSIATVGDNFNPQSPYNLPSQEPRVPFFNDQGRAVYHGFHAGLQYIW